MGEYISSGTYPVTSRDSHNYCSECAFQFLHLGWQKVAGKFLHLHSLCLLFNRFEWREEERGANLLSWGALHPTTPAATRHHSQCASFAAPRLRCSPALAGARRAAPVAPSAPVPPPPSTADTPMARRQARSGWSARCAIPSPRRPPFFASGRAPPSSCSRFTTTMTSSGRARPLSTSYPAPFRSPQLPTSSSLLPSSLLPPPRPLVFPPPCSAPSIPSSPLLSNPPSLPASRLPRCHLLQTLTAGCRATRLDRGVRCVPTGRGRQPVTAHRTGGNGQS